MNSWLSWSWLSFIVGLGVIPTIIVVLGALWTGGLIIKGMREGKGDKETTSD